MDNIQEFLDWRKDPDLCEYIHAQAARHCGRSPETFEDMRQEAWLYISLLPPGVDILTLKRTAYNAIHRLYESDRKGRHLSFEVYFTAIHRQHH